MSVEATVTSGPFDAGEPCTLEIAVRADHALAPGDTVEWQLPHSWTELYGGASYTKPLQVTDSEGDHYVSVAADDASFDLEIRERQLPDADMETRHGRHLVATLTEGEVPAETDVYLRLTNTIAPTLARIESVWVRVADEAPETDPTVRTRPGPVEWLRIIAPSGVEPGESFDVRLVPLDEWDNEAIAEFADESFAVADGEVLVDDLTVTGATIVEVSLDEPGVHRLRFRDTLSNPIRVGEGARGPFWGDIHAHTGLSHDGLGNAPYRYAREVSGLEFAATTEHVETLGEVGNDVSLKRTEAANDPGTFVTLPAYEITLPDACHGGHYNFYFRSESAYRNWMDRTDNLTTPEAEYRAWNDGTGDSSAESSVPLDVDLVIGDGPADRPSPSELMVVPHHTGIGFAQCDPADLGAIALAPVIELYSHHGQSERYDPQHALAYEFNRFRRPERRSNRSIHGPFYGQDFWTAGHRLGVICSSDDHAAKLGRSVGGVAAVSADDLTRESVFDAIQARRCYGTTGERILLEFSIDDAGMGEITTVSPGDRLQGSLDVWGTDVLIDVEILRHRVGIDDGFVPVVSETPYPSAEAVEIRAPEAMESSIEFDVDVEGECIYYARVTQCPVEWPAMAWSSPIWIDVSE